VRFVFDAADGDERLGRRARASGPDAFDLIQAYDDHFSCSIEWMRLANEGLLRRRRRPRRGSPGPEGPSAPSD
jgi:hypothetical protein